MTIEELAAESIKSAKNAAEEYSRLKGWNLNSLKGLICTTKVVVKHAEEIGLREGLQGADKKKLAVELILKIVKLPWWMPQGIVREILDAAIDIIVDALKDKFKK